MKANKILIYLDLSCKRKFIIKTSILTDEKIKLKKNFFFLKKVNNSIKSYELNKKNQKMNIMKKIKEFEKKYNKNK